jgi:hypothetical protein
MVSQKRRKFEIKQKQKRHAKKTKVNSDFKKIVYEQNVLLRKLNQLIERNTRVSNAEFEQIKNEMNQIDQQSTLFFKQSIGNERIFGKDEQTLLRHDIKDKMFRTVLRLNRLKQKN